MEGSSTAPSARQSKSGPNCYVSHLDKPGATAFHKALAALFPAGLNDRQLVAFFDNRAPLQSVKQWRIGRRNPPQWAIDLLRQKADRLRELAYAAQAGPGSIAGRKNLLRGTRR